MSSRESNHISNHQNYYRFPCIPCLTHSGLVSGESVHEELNTIIFEFDDGLHMNNVFLYGYPSSSDSRLPSMSHSI